VNANGSAQLREFAWSTVDGVLNTVRSWLACHSTLMDRVAVPATAH
jgi:hypothetical protein